MCPTSVVGNKEKSMAATGPMPQSGVTMPPGSLAPTGLPAAVSVVPSATGVQVGTGEPIRLDKDWQAANCTKPTGVYIESAIAKFNADNHTDFTFLDITDLETHSIDPKTGLPTDDGGISVGERNGKAVLVTEYWITVKKKDGKEEKIAIHQTWDTDIDIPTPGAEDEKSAAELHFERETQAYFAGIDQKLTFILIPNKNPKPGSPQFSVSPSRMKELRKLKEFNPMKYCAFDSSGKIGDHFFTSMPIGSNINRPYIVSRLVYNATTGKFKWRESMYDEKPVHCPHLDIMRSRLITTEAIVEQERLDPAKAETDARFKTSLGGIDQHFQILRSEIELAGDRTRELAAFKLNEQGEIDPEKTKSDELRIALSAREKTVKAEAKVKAAKVDRDAIISKINARKVRRGDTGPYGAQEVVQPDDWLANRKWLEERGVIPELGSLQEAIPGVRHLPHGRSVPEPATAALKADEKEEIAERLQLWEANKKVAEAGSGIGALKKQFMDAQSVYVSKAEAYKKQLGQLTLHYATIKRAYDFLVQRMGKEDPEVKQLDRELEELNKELTNLGFFTGSLQAQVRRFDAKVDEYFGAKKAGVAAPLPPPPGVAVGVAPPTGVAVGTLPPPGMAPLSPVEELPLDPPVEGLVPTTVDDDEEGFPEG